jgi:hypothetical protein
MRSAMSTEREVFPFHGDVFCSDGHEDMAGEIVVTEG